MSKSFSILMTVVDIILVLIIIFWHPEGYALEATKAVITFCAIGIGIWLIVTSIKNNKNG